MYVYFNKYVIPEWGILYLYYKKQLSHSCVNVRPTETVVGWRVERVFRDG